MGECKDLARREGEPLRPLVHLRFDATREGEHLLPSIYPRFYARREGEPLRPLVHLRFDARRKGEPILPFFTSVLREGEPLLLLNFDGLMFFVVV